MGSPVEVIAQLQTEDTQKLENFETIKKFFSLYLEDKQEFYSLWVEDDPIVYLPFTTEGVAVLHSAALKGWPEVKSFWDPIFNWQGTFDWIITDVIFGEDPNTIITKAQSKIDAKTDETFNNVHLKYQGIYLQIFKFENGKVKSFEEYYDTDFLNQQYSQ